MKLVRWKPETRRPMGSLLDFGREFDRLFDVGHFGGESWSPQMDVYEEKDAVVLKADLPGLTKDDVEVHVEDNIVTIEGTKKKENEEKDGTYYRCERWHGSFRRAFELPAGVEASKVKARFKDGVLTVTLPRSEASKPQKVDIEIK